ncbi:MAG TPA: HEXXH motif-containing putative peptide modification protein [Sandaracinaceae bacterium LLY-WYZ-13_1]|nr:HEXXH motif-containing putative peptide modification protein [Sandaracinaceae bacterium LLY-WYZ-13_1]
MIEPPTDLTVPRGSSDTVRRILSAALRRLLGDLGSLPLARASRPVARATHAVLRATRAELSREPGRVFGALRRPNVGTAVRVLRDLDDPARIDAVAAQLACTLAVELAVAGAELPPLSFPRGPARVVCLGGRFVLPGGSARLQAGRWTAAGTAIDLAAAARGDAAVERPFSPIEGDLVLALADDNPLAMLEAHPDKSGNAVALGDRAPEAWCDALRGALAVIETHLPLVREEAALVLHQVVPVGFDAHQHLSASYREAIGTIYLTLHPRQMTMAEAVIHELSHNELNALFELDPVLHNAFSPLFTSPVRPDPRPLHGVLLAVHAFLPVAELYRRMIEAQAPGSDHPDFRRRYATVVRQNREGVAVLREHAEPTEVGRGLLDEIARLDASFDDVARD